MVEPSAVDTLRRAVVFHQAGRLDQAIRDYRQAIAAQPGLVEAHLNLGIALAALGQLEAAAQSCRRARDLAPGRADCHINLANVLHAQGRAGEAAAAYRQGLAIAPDDAGALYNLGNLLLRETELAGAALYNGDRIAETFACLERHARLAQGGAPQPQPPHKLRHDREQRDYLAAQGETAGPFHLGDGGRVTGAAVNAAGHAAVERQWRESHPQIVVIDNLLTDQALEKLRRFCWSSTIWRQPHAQGYLTALPEFGLACPLLAQIAAELCVAYPAIFSSHPLRYLWGFKYDSTLGGVAVHADQAAVNVNFWITPDEANLDPAHGGLVVWDARAPRDWNFSRYNGDAAAARAFLARSNARPTTIPYRANRAVIFDSDLSHQTDRMAFRDGYLDRRINITLLYGTRTGA